MSDTVLKQPDPVIFVRGLREIFVRYSLFFICIAVVLTFSILRPDFTHAENIKEVLISASISGIMFLGVTWVVAAGEIDISFMEVAALSDMLVAGLVNAGWGWPLAACVGLLAGVAVGLLNGFLVGYMRLPALITTLATGGFARSMAAVIGLGSSVEVSHTGVVGRFLNLHFGFLPAVAVLTIVLYAIGWFIQEKLVFGHYIYAMEQNREAVVEAGIPARRLTLLVYLISGIAAAIAGILLTASLASGQPRIGVSFFIDGLTTVLLGGMVIKIGQPNVLGTLLAVLLLAVLVSGTALLGWSDWERDILKGALLFIGVTIVVKGRATPETAQMGGAH
ncbi:MAG TPA: ABC transporter permease [Acidocella sp.]|nr:ABC transporter permease [Acidocella sp.]